MVSTGSYNTSLETGNLDTWSIGLDGQGHISIDHNLNNGSTLLMTSNSPFNDSSWHHLSIVKNAKSNTTMYVDGIEQASCSSELTRGFGVLINSWRLNSIETHLIMSIQNTIVERSMSLDYGILRKLLTTKSI